MSAHIENGTQMVSAASLSEFVARLFSAAGLSSAAAATVARGLVEADLEGLPSHGVMLVDMYIGRLLKGSVSSNESASVISERQGAVVLDAGHALGQLTGTRAMTIAVDKARRFAAGVVSVRHGFHFGAAGRYARQAAEAGCIGIAMCNTRPLMPAPGGAERVVGNNPIAIAVPTDGAMSNRARHGDKRSRDGKDPPGGEGQRSYPLDMGGDRARRADDKSIRGHRGHASAVGGR